MDKDLSKKVPLTQAKYEDLKGRGFEIKEVASKRIGKLELFIDDTADEIYEKKEEKKSNRESLLGTSSTKKEQKGIIRRAKKSMRVAQKSAETLQELFFRDPKEVEKAIELTIKESRNTEKGIPSKETLFSESLSFHKQSDGTIGKLTPSGLASEFGEAIATYTAGHSDLASASYELVTSDSQEKELRVDRKEINKGLRICRINKRNAKKELENQRDVYTSTSFRLAGLAIKHFIAAKLKAKVYVKRNYYKDTRCKYFDTKLLNKNNT